VNCLFGKSIYRPKSAPYDVKIAIHTVGICGSDVHYYEYGAIGPFVVKEQMVLGHEASGTVVEVGRSAKNLKPGDRVCMEPGIPDPSSRASRLGIYNLDPAVRFWATPPIHGRLAPYVIHPAAYTFKLPENVSFAEGAMVEPLAVGMHAAVKAKDKVGGYDSGSDISRGRYALADIWDGGHSGPTSFFTKLCRIRQKPEILHSDFGTKVSGEGLIRSPVG
jgi:threonine dehydrogenase-like Zn-dependent dehydrogenase